MKTILYLLGASYLAVFGVFATVRPAKVRDFCVRQYASALGDLLKSGDSSGLDRYVPRATAFRVFGLTSLVASALIVYFLFRT
ncbi:MAG TPA: hypothetical protein VLJ61_10275 [Pyrinomonadaceae bacterium]|nr:hypothetical protein [Pyrinomonadaceae bacterium]